MARRATDWDRRAPDRPEGVSDKDWRLFLGNQLIVTEDNPYEVPVKLRDAERQSSWWPSVEMELSKQWPDYLEVERLIGYAVADDFNRQANAEGELNKDCKTCGKPYGPPHDGYSNGYCYQHQPQYVPGDSSLWQSVRNITLFMGGLSMVAWEMFGTDTVQPTLLVLAAAMMGLPAFLRGAVSSRGVGVALVALVAAGGLLAASHGISDASVRAQNEVETACVRANVTRTQVNKVNRVTGMPGVRLHDCSKISQGR